MKRRLFGLLTAVLTLGLVAASCGSEGATMTRAAFVYVGPVGDAGWTWAHEQGRLAAEATTGVETAFVESVSEGGADFADSVRQFIDDDYDVIIGTSVGISRLYV